MSTEEALRAVAEAPDDPVALERFLTLAVEQGVIDDALASLETLILGGQARARVAWDAGLYFQRRARSAEAARAFALAFQTGCRDPHFLRGHLHSLVGLARHHDVLKAVEVLRREGLDRTHREASRHLAMLAGHAKLSLAQPPDREIALAEARAASPAWLDVPALKQTIVSAIRERRPFALIRISDGEARFLIGEMADEASGPTAEEIHAIGDVIWENWFGEHLSAADPMHRSRLLSAFEDALRTADVIGVATPERLRSDTAHYGYLAWQERWLRALLAGRDDVRFTDGLVHKPLNDATQFLAELLEGQDVFGVISPHPKLADLLAKRLGIGRAISHVIPAESRLPTKDETRALGRHFPDMYDALLANLSVPRPGCVFLVAAGLLGKIYCARIRALGGIAIDIGALADAWMGYDTRHGQLKRVPALQEPAATESGPPQPSRVTYGCLSFGKTGSMACARAIRDAGFKDAVHLHFLGPRGIAFHRRRPQPMLQLAEEVAGRLASPDHEFRFVTGIRDPIARILSSAFYSASRRDTLDKDFVRDREALIAWWESQIGARIDLYGGWFDDTYKATFGFDFREHPFDHERKSLRFASDRLRVLVLRQEDDRAAKEAEIGWLIDRRNVVLPIVNDSKSQRYETGYRAFIDTFVAPTSWLDKLYETDAMRHFYTDAERAAFRARWSRTAFDQRKSR